MNPQHGGAQPGYVPPWSPPAGQPPVPGPPRRRGFSWATASVGLVAVAALIVGILALTKPSPGPAPSSAGSPSTSPSSTSTPAADTTSANKALCQAIAPLMTESDSVTNAYIDSGGTKSPERIAATPKFVSDTKDWASRIQPTIEAHPGVDPYFARTLQRFVDDRRLLITDLDAGPSLPYDDAVYADSMAAYNGPLRTCYDLGVRW